MWGILVYNIYYIRLGGARIQVSSKKYLNTGLFVETNEPTLVVGDLNIHTAYTDPLRSLEPGERRRGEHYMRLAALRGYNIINTPGIYTRFPDNPIIH